MEAWTEEERRLLSRFFSRVEPREHADVYAVRRLPQEIRATLNGLYSRSHLSMRDTFLKRLRQGLEAQGKKLEDLPFPESTSEEVLEGVLVDKAGEFLRTYAIDHGHNSLREGAVVQLAIENVSQLVTRFIERERRASFEESSTRYISFSREGHWRDPDVREAGGEWAADYEDALRETFDFYRKSIETLRAHIAAKRPLRKGEEERAWKRAVRAEAYDSARYLLTPALHTKFGMVADARTIADTCQRLLSHPLREFKIVGEAIREAAEVELPTLLAHARANPYLAEGPAAEARAAGFLGAEDAREEPSPDATIPEGDNEVRLLEAPEDLDARILSGALFESTGLGLEELRSRIASLDEGKRAAIFEALCAKRGARDAMPEGFEGGGLLEFEILCDFGAYRDIARHRKGFQQQQCLTTAHGFCTPPLFDEAGIGGEYRAVLERVGRRARRLARRFPEAAGYVIPFAYRQRVRIAFDARQMAYFCELRSAPEGHFSYRGLAIEMARALEAKAPLYARWLRLCRERVFLGRVEAEQGADARREARAARAREKGFA